jgi:branched-subunit amino acid transport protein
MSAVEYLLLIGLMTATTVITRSFFFMHRGASKMPGWLQQALTYVPAVALSAILAPDLLMLNGVLVTPWSNIRLLAAIAATVFFLWTRHLLGTLAFGMAVFTLLRLLG